MFTHDYVTLAFSQIKSNSDSGRQTGLAKQPFMYPVPHRQKGPPPEPIIKRNVSLVAMGDDPWAYRNKVRPPASDVSAYK